MKLHSAIFLLVGLNLYHAPSYSENNCGVEVYQAYVDYRVSLNSSIGFGDTKHHINYSNFLESAESGFRDKSLFYKIIMGKKNIEVEAIKNIERMNKVRRESVGIKSYFSVCNENRGELFMRAVLADSRYTDTSMLFQKVRGAWLINSPQLFNYSNLLSENIIFDERKGDFVFVYKNFLSDPLRNCLSKLDGTNLSYDNYDEFSKVVSVCYSQVN